MVDLQLLSNKISSNMEILYLLNLMYNKSSILFSSPQKHHQFSFAAGRSRSKEESTSFNVITIIDIEGTKKDVNVGDIT